MKSRLGLSSARNLCEKTIIRHSVGQGTVEYLLMLMVAMMAFFLVVRSGLGPMLAKFQDDMSSRITGAFFKGGSAGEALHQLRIGR